jgi:hypothetical protein
VACAYSNGCDATQSVCLHHLLHPIASHTLAGAAHPIKQHAAVSEEACILQMGSSMQARVAYLACACSSGLRCHAASSSASSASSSALTYAACSQQLSSSVNSCSSASANPSHLHTCGESEISSRLQKDWRELEGRQPIEVKWIQLQWPRQHCCAS